MIDSCVRLIGRDALPLYKLSSVLSSSPDSPLQWCSYLFLWRRSELFGLLGSEGCRHVECQHHFIVAEPLVVLETGHKVIREGHHRLDTMTHLAVTQVLEHMAHLHTHVRHTCWVNYILWWQSSHKFVGYSAALCTSVWHLCHCRVLLDLKRFFFEI